MSSWSPASGGWSSYVPSRQGVASTVSGLGGVASGVYGAVSSSVRFWHLRPPPRCWLADKRLPLATRGCRCRQGRAICHPCLQDSSASATCCRLEMALSTVAAGNACLESICSFARVDRRHLLSKRFRAVCGAPYPDAGELLRMVRRAW